MAYRRGAGKNLKPKKRKNMSYENDNNYIEDVQLEQENEENCSECECAKENAQEEKKPFYNVVGVRFRDNG